VARVSSTVPTRYRLLPTGFERDEWEIDMRSRNGGVGVIGVIIIVIVILFLVGVIRL
jgi:hypothetical protein